MNYNLDIQDDKVNGFKYLHKLAADGKLPEFLKNEKMLTGQELDLLDDGDFALILVDKDKNIHRKFPVCDRANTWLSAFYFDKVKGSLPPKAAAIAARSILHALEEDSLLFYKPLDGIRESLYETRDTFFHGEPYLADLSTRGTGLENVYRETDETPIKEDDRTVQDIEKELLKSAKKERSKIASADFALVFEKEGTVYRLFPLTTSEQVKKADAYFESNWKFLTPEQRHNYSKALHSHAKTHNVDLTSKMASRYYSEDYSDCVDMSLSLRIKNAKTEEAKTAYTKLANLKKSLSPEKFACMLNDIDRATGADKGYGKTLYNAFESTFGTKVASNQMLQYSGKTVSPQEIQQLDVGDLGGLIDEGTLEDLHNDPFSVFQSLPNPYKDLILQVLGK